MNIYINIITQYQRNKIPHYHIAKISFQLDLSDFKVL